MHFGEFVADVLQSLNFKAVFAVPGVPITQSLQYIQERIPVVVTRHENAAVNAAAAFGYHAGRFCYTESPHPDVGSPGLAIVTGGPGIMNALSQAISASGNRFPLVIVSVVDSFVERPYNVSAPRAFQQLPIEQLAANYRGQGLIKEVIAVSRNVDLENALVAARNAALRDSPKAVLVLIAWEMWNSEMPFSPKRTKAQIIPRPVGNPLIPRLSSFEKPLIIVGEMLAYYGLGSQIHFKLCGMNPQIPMLTTPQARGLVPETVDICGARTKALSESDLVIFVGCSLDWRFSPKKSWWSEKKLVVADVPFCDPSAFIMSVLSMELPTPKHIDWLKQLRDVHLTRLQDGKKMKALSGYHERKHEGSILLQGFYQNLSEIIENHTHIFVVSEGATSMDAARKHLHLSRESAAGRYLDAGVYGAMGVGIPYAIGSAVWGLICEPMVSGKSGVVMAFIGDSAWGFSGTEMETIQRYNLPLVLTIIDNGGMYAIDPNRIHSDTVEESVVDRFKIDPTDLSAVNYTKLLNLPPSHMIKISTPNEEEKVKNLIEEFLVKNDSPRVIHVLVDPREGSGQGHVHDLVILHSQKRV